MITSTILFVLIGALPYKPIISAYIDYEPIKITVNENFNAAGQMAQGLPTIDAGFVHQGGNFYFKPQLNLRPNYIPSDIEALISRICQKTESCKKEISELVVGNDKVTEILTLLEEPISDFTKETLSGIVAEKEIITKILKPLDNFLPELIVIPEEIEKNEVFIEEVKITEVSTPTPVEVIIGQKYELPPPPPSLLTPIIISEDPKPIISELVVIPEAPVLPPLSLNVIYPVAVEEVKTEEPILFEESIEAFPSFPEISTGPIPGSIIVPEITDTFGLENIHSVVAQEEVKIDEPILLEGTIGVFPPTPEISTGPIPGPIIVPEITDTFGLENIHSVVSQEEKIDEPKLLEESIGVFPPIPEIFTGPIPEPVIVPEITDTFGLENIHSVVAQEEVKIDEPIFLEGTIGVFPPTPEISTGPIPGPIIVPEITDTFGLENIHSVVSQEEKIDEPKLLEESIGVFPPIPEIFTRPIPEPVIVPEITDTFGLENIHSVVAQDEVKIDEPILLEGTIGVFPPTPEISTGPIRGPIVVPKITDTFGLENIHSVVSQEEKIDEPKLLEESMGVFPPIPEIFTGPIPEPVIVPENTDIFGLENIPPVVEEEEVKIDEPILLEESIGVFPPISEISTGSIPKPIIVPEVTNFFVLENIRPVILEEVKVEDYIEVFPKVTEISTGPVLESIKVPEVTNSFVVFKEVSQPKPCPQCVIRVKENLTPAIIPQTPKRMGVFTYVPIVSQLSTRVPKIKAKEFITPELTSLQHTYKNHPFRFPLNPSPKLPLNIIMDPKFGKNHNFLYPTSSAHNVVEKRIAPHMTFKKKTPKHGKMYTSPFQLIERFNKIH